MKVLAITLLLLLIYNVYYTVHGSNEILKHLGTRTPYRFVYNKDISKIKYPHCKDSKIWMLIRHGTRYSGVKDITAMNTTLKDLKYEILLQHKMGKGKLNKHQLSRLEDWNIDINLDNDKQKYLTEVGQEEMIQLAERMQKRFPNAVKNKYDNSTFQFRYTATQRAQESAKYFTVGLFKKSDFHNIAFEKSSEVDIVLRSYKHCDKWRKQVKKNPDTYKEQIAFGLSQTMNDTLQTVSIKLGLDRVLCLGDVLSIYRTCGFETAWNKHEISPWCAAFDVDTIKVMEYYYELKHYWLDGYGHELTYRQACLTLNNMFNNFMLSPVREGGAKPATFLFAHSGTLLKVVSLLQLYRPPRHLTAATLGPHSRAWTTSTIDCFGSNLAFVLYKCKDGDKVLTLHQERPVRLPMCPHELCPLQLLREHFHDSIHKCDYSDLCSLRKEDEL